MTTLCFTRLQVLRNSFTAILSFLILAQGIPGQGQTLPTDQEGNNSSPYNKWIDKSGNQLPFKSVDEVLSFLKTAKIIDIEKLGMGTTRPWRVLLAKDGIQARAIFRYVEKKKTKADLGKQGTMYNFLDSHRHEVAAFHLGRLMGLDCIPPVVLRTIRAKRGSLQLWVENTMTETDRILKNIQPKSGIVWARQNQMMHNFDYLIYNFDRNQGNILYDSDWNCWFIDHTRSFRTLGEPETIKQIIWCEKSFWEKLKSVSEENIQAHLDSYLAPPQIQKVLERRRKLISHIEQLIQENGSSGVLFNMTKPGFVPKVENLY